MVLATILAILASIQSGVEGFIFAFGLTCLVGAGICFFLALISMLGKDRELTNAMFLSAGILLLIGTGVCSTLLIGGLSARH